MRSLIYIQTDTVTAIPLLLPYFHLGMSLALVSRRLTARTPLSRIESIRLLSTNPANKPRFFQRTYSLSRIGIVTGSVLAVSAWLASARGTDGTIYADAQEPLQSKRPPTPLSTLIRSYIVYSFCSVPVIVDWSPTILSTLFSIPGLKQLTEAFVRVTFFDHVSNDFLIIRLSSEHIPCICWIHSLWAEIPRKTRFLCLSNSGKRIKDVYLPIASRSTSMKQLVKTSRAAPQSSL